MYVHCCCPQNPFFPPSPQAPIETLDLKPLSPLPSPGHFAIITLTFIDKNGETELCMEGRGIPAPEEERTRQGWQRYYFEGIKQTFGYGARLF